jgi:hypothetical protein
MYGERKLRRLKKELLDERLITEINRLLKENIWNGYFGEADIIRVEKDGDDVKIFVMWKVIEWIDGQVVRRMVEGTVEEFFEKVAGEYSYTRAQEKYLDPFFGRMRRLIRMAKERLE